MKPFITPIMTGHLFWVTLTLLVSSQCAASSTGNDVINDVILTQSKNEDGGLKTLVDVLQAAMHGRSRDRMKSGKSNLNLSNKKLKDIIASFYPVAVAYVDENDFHKQVTNPNLNLTSGHSYNSGSIEKHGENKLQKRPSFRVPHPNEPLPWHCRNRKEWEFLGPDIFPRYMQVTKCTQENCYYGHFTCKSVKVTVKVLKRLFNDGEDWEEMDYTISVACECGRND